MGTMRKILPLLICLISGCEGLTPAPETPDFRQLYAEMSVVENHETEQAENVQKASLSVKDMPLPAFARYIANTTGLSIISDEALDAKTVTIEAIDAPLDHILSSVARRLTVSISRQGNIYYIGTLRPEDKGLLVRKVRRLAAEQLTSSIGTLLTETGRTATFSDGLVVVSDTVKILQQVNSLLNQIESAPANTWVIQMFLVSMSDTAQKTLGVDTEFSAEVAVNLADRSTDFSGSLSALLSATKTRSGAKILAQPLFLLLDGETASIKDGQSIPIPKKSTSDYGTVTTEAYEYTEVGVLVSCALREQTVKSASCNIGVTMTSVSGYIETAPIITGQNFNSAISIEAGKTYLAGSISRKEEGVTQSGSPITTLFKRSGTEGIVQVWIKCYRIQGDYQKGDNHGIRPQGESRDTELDEPEGNSEIFRR